MKIEKHPDGIGFTLTNSAGDSLNVSFMEFWDICRAGDKMDTKDEVEAYLKDCTEIGDYDIQRIRAFPTLIDKITEQVIKDRIDDESGDQIYDAANKCISEYIAELEGKVKWFRLSEDKCISVWYAPDEHDGDQFQMHLEERGEDGYMGPACEIISDDSYATRDISFEALCETLSEICDDAEVYDDEYPWLTNSNTAAMIAQEIFDAFGVQKSNVVMTKPSLDKKIKLAETRVFADDQEKGTGSAR